MSIASRSYTSAAAFLLREPNQEVEFSLKPGQMVACLTKGRAPRLHALDGPGTYLLDALDLAGDASGFPILVVVITEEHTTGWQRLTPEAVDSMIQSAVDVVRSRDG